MEETPVTAAPVMDTTTTNNNNDLAIVVAVPLATNSENVSINGEKNIKKKRSGGFSLFKAARLIFRPKPSEKPKPPAIQSDVASNGAADNWKKIVGSIRPLHLQDHPLPFPPPLTVNTAAVDYENQPAVEQFEDVIPAPVSPTLTSSSASEGSPSVYGSAMNLQELDNHGESEDDDEEEDEDQVFDDKPADAMIDAKAEEFIAHFYAQMRRQQLDSAYYPN